MLFRNRGISTGLCAAAIALGVTAVSAAEEIKPLADGFPNQSLRIVVVDNPGTADSLYATALVKAAEGLSPVPIKIDHRPDFSTWGTWEAQAWMEQQGDASNDGYLMAVFPAPGIIIDLLATDMKKAVGVDLRDFNPVILTERLPYFLHQRSDAPWGDTLEDLIKYAKEHPNTVRYISGGPGAGQDAAMKWYLDKLGFTVKEIIGGNSFERALAVASKEGDITVSPPDTILPHYEAGRLDVLMMAGSEKAPEPWSKVPSSASFGLENDPWSTQRGLVVTKAVPKEHRLWLEALFTKAANDPEFIKLRKQIPGIQLKVLSGDETSKLLQNLYDQALPIMKKIGIYWGDKK